MEITIEINMDTRAFRNEGELSRILSSLAERMDRFPAGEGEEGTIKDRNSTAVGAWRIA